MRFMLAPGGVLVLCVACGARVEVHEDGSEPQKSTDWGELREAVMGGTIVHDGRWDEVSAHACSGVLIAPRWVLTAAHCTLGNTDVQLQHREEGHEVVDTITHPDWQNTLDVGLLQLASEASVPPARPALGCGSQYVVDGATVQIVGYGATSPDGSQFNDEMREATTEIVDADCSDDGWSCLMPGKELIAGHPGVDTCPGDSGGPLYVLSSVGPLLAGITSRAANPGATPTGGVEEPCGTVPGLYVRVDAVVDWIEETIGEPLPEPDCAEGDGPSPGTPSSFSDSGSLRQGEQHQLEPVDVQPGTPVTVTMTGAGDADLYVRFAGAPTLSRHDCRPYLETADEECQLTVPGGASQLFVMVDGYTASSYDVVASYVTP
jgi:hypothetical protein